jgi:aconitate decarboxylase
VTAATTYTSRSSGVTGRLATWLARTELADVPEDVRERAMHILLDGIGCALVGVRLPWSDIATEAVLGLEGDGGRCELIGVGRSTTPSAAALLNSSYVQSFELDDYHPAAPVHSCSLVLPALLSASAVRPAASGADAVLGAILGFEVGPRVGLALHGAEMINRGWHPGPVFGGPSAAAAAGKLYRLGAAAYEDALGLAATQAGGLMSAQFGAMSKRMQHGFAARNGVLAAALAAGGYQGIDQVFERDFGGFLSVFGEGHDPDSTQIDSELGERWETLRIAIKPYAAMAGLHASIDATRQLLASHSPSSGDLRAIRIDVSEAAFHHGGWRAERPLTTVGAQMNLAYAVAVTLLDGTALIQQFSDRRLESDDVWELIERTTVCHDEGFDERYEDGYNARVTLTLNDGTDRTGFVEHPRGGLREPLANSEIVEKFRLLAGLVVDAGRAQAIEDVVLTLDRQPDLRSLVDLLSAPARAVLDPEEDRS